MLRAENEDLKRQRLLDKDVANWEKNITHLVRELTALRGKLIEEQQRTADLERKVRRRHRH